MDSSDPGLWLLYVNALRAAGKEDDAVANLDRAYQAYLLAGQPEELQGPPAAGVRNFTVRSPFLALLP